MTEVLLRARDLRVVRCRSRSRAAAYAIRDTIADFIPGKARERKLRPGEFLALDGVDLDLRSGDAVAVLGKNGAGKSTLLKALGGLISPQAGSIERRGRVETVSELGAGLNPSLSGRENSRLCAHLRETPNAGSASYLEQVWNFADLGAAIDEQVGSYSTGMTARLAFALAAMTNPDVLLVDEALSVGDLDFQRKSARFIQDYLSAGGALVFASHNLLQVQSLCDRALLLDEGKTVCIGPAVDTVQEMISRALPASAPAVAAETGGNAIRLVHFGDGDGLLRTNAHARLEVEYQLTEPFPDALWGFSLWTADGEQCVTTAYDLEPTSLAPGVGRLRCEIDKLTLAPGHFTMRLDLVDRLAGVPIALAGWGRDTIPLRVESTSSIESNYQLESRQLMVLDVNWRQPDDAA